MKQTKTRTRGADAVAAALQRIGTSTLFVMSGNQLMPVFDACLDTDLRLVHVRHEAAAVHMADAWGRMTGTPGVALLPAGPGFLNGLSALYSARMSESPVVVLSGSAPAARAGQGAFQEMPQAEMAASLCKESWTAGTAGDLGPAVTKAAEVALSGRPGPVHVALPFDLLDEDAGTPPDDGPATAAIGADADFAPVLDALAAADKPLILAGPLLLQPHLGHLPRALEEATGVPVVAMESPRGINDPALGAFAGALAAADCVVLLGKRADYALRFGEALAAEARVIYIDPEHEERARARTSLGGRLSLAVEADVQTAIDRMIASAPGRKTAGDGWRETVRAAVTRRPADWADMPDGADGAAHPVNAARAIQAALAADPEAVLVVDGGEFGQWAQACIAAPSRIINGPSGAIGGSLPFAIAAKLAKPDAAVFAVMGDGTAGFHLAEFDTAARYGIAVVAVIGNDARWNAEYQIQLRDYGPERLIGCELGQARYDEAAAGLGCHGEYAPRADAIAGCLERAIKSGKPACVNVLIDGEPAPVIR